MLRAGRSKGTAPVPGEAGAVTEPVQGSGLALEVGPGLAGGHMQGKPAVIDPALACGPGVLAWLLALQGAVTVTVLLSCDWSSASLDCVARLLVVEF